MHVPYGKNLFKETKGWPLWVARAGATTGQMGATGRAHTSGYQQEAEQVWSQRSGHNLEPGPGGLTTRSGHQAHCGELFQVLCSESPPPPAPGARHVLSESSGVGTAAPRPGPWPPQASWCQASDLRLYSFSCFSSVHTGCDEGHCVHTQCTYACSGHCGHKSTLPALGPSVVLACGQGLSSTHQRSWAEDLSPQVMEDSRMKNKCGVFTMHKDYPILAVLLPGVQGSAEQTRRAGRLDPAGLCRLGHSRPVLTPPSACTVGPCYVTSAQYRGSRDSRACCSCALARLGLCPCGKGTSYFQFSWGREATPAHPRSCGFPGLCALRCAGTFVL